MTAFFREKIPINVNSLKNLKLKIRLNKALFWMLRKEGFPPKPACRQGRVDRQTYI
jgi:hypothetical protein